VGGEGDGGLCCAAALRTISCDGMSVMLCDLAVMPTPNGMLMWPVDVVEGCVDVVTGVMEGGVGSLLPKEGTRLMGSPVCSVLIPSPMGE
jgi:hypothetical protein